MMRYDDVPIGGRVVGAFTPDQLRELWGLGFHTELVSGAVHTMRRDLTRARAMRRDVLAAYGLAACAKMDRVEAERTPGFPHWGVRIHCTSGRPEFLEVGMARRLARDLRLIVDPNDAEAQLIEHAASEAGRQMRAAVAQPMHLRT